MLLGDRESVDSHREHSSESGESPQALLLRANELDVTAHLEERRHELEEYGGAPSGDSSAEAEPSTRLTIDTDILTGEPLSEVFLATVPTSDSSELPANLELGGWNECPFPPEHVAGHQLWHEHYRSEILGISRDVIECHVPSPPREREAAMTLAGEQCGHAPDIVDEGAETLSDLSAALLNGTARFFWWD